MADVYDITPRLPRKTQFEALAMDAGAFDGEREKLFGARARIAALMLAKTQAELRHDFEDDPEALADLAEVFSALSDECKAVQAIVDAALARLLIVGNEMICADA